MYMKPEFKGKGFAHDEQRKSLNAMNTHGYKYALCTVEGSNLAQQRVLTKSGWEKLTEFFDDCTGHEVFLYGLLVGVPV